MPLRYWIILLALGAAFGASFSLNEVLLAQYGPVTVSAMRVALGASGCWAWVFATGRRVRVAPGMLLGLFLFGIFQYAAPFALLPLAQERITSGVAGIANAMTPVAVVVISHFWQGGERATAPRIAGVGLGLVGICLLARPGGGAGTSEPAFIAIAVGAPVCYGIALNLVRRFRGIDPAVITAWAMSGGAAAVVPFALLREGMPVLPDAQALAAIGTLGFVLTSAAFLIMYALLPRVGATNLSLVTFMAPVSALIIGSLALGEPLGHRHAVSFALIVAGLACIDGRALRGLARLWGARAGLPATGL